GGALSAAALMAIVPPGVRQAAWAAGSDAPEKREVKIGFSPLTDCASVVMAAVNEFDKKYGIKIIPTKEASWASVRDKLVNGNMDGFCVGEPWGHRAIADGIGITGITTQDIWKDHPEKVLGCTADFVKQNPNTARAMTAAIIDAGRWIDASLSNRQKMAEVVADRAYVNTDKDVIVARMLGRYDNGIGKTWDDKDHMKFFNDGVVNFPYLSDGMWFMTQHR